MSKVYYRKIDSKTTVAEIQKITQELLSVIVSDQSLVLEKKIPLKVHFGEKGNHTFIKPEKFIGIVDFLKSRGIESCYIETSVMYGGQRHRRDIHLKTAQEHGFTQLPVEIADGEQGELFTEVKTDLKHFKTCKIGRDFDRYNQLIVLSHFKGHMLAGFGGAIKQLSMGHASKGGKLAMHMGIKPQIIKRKCKKCNLCKTRCNEGAIIIDSKVSAINHEKCVGCGACVSICPHKAVSIMSLKGLWSMLFKRESFQEKIVEYAYAAQKGKKNIYLNFAMNITRGCDCEPRKMKPLTDDFGIFISTDSVAIDQACLDLARENGVKFNGEKLLQYAEMVGLGSRKYELVAV
jgi:uncharacterized Fe-S center protein